MTKEEQYIDMALDITKDMIMDSNFYFEDDIDYTLEEVTDALEILDLDIKDVEEDFKNKGFSITEGVDGNLTIIALRTVFLIEMIDVIKKFGEGKDNVPFVVVDFARFYLQC